MSSKQLLLNVHLGQRGYQWTLALQTRIFEAKIASQKALPKGPNGIVHPHTESLLPDFLLTVEHVPGAYTVGKRPMGSGHFRDEQGQTSGPVGACPYRKCAITSPEATCPKPTALSSSTDLAATLPASHAGVEVVKTRRGGGVTYHGKGQLTAYPILNARQLWAAAPSSPPKGTSPLRWYTTAIEASVMRMLADGYGIPSEPALTGVWANQKKIASIGLQVSDWVTMHGVAINIFDECVPYFDKIVMCELPDKEATCVRSEVRQDASSSLTDVQASNRANLSVWAAARLYADVLHHELYLPPATPQTTLDLTTLTEEQALKEMERLMVPIPEARSILHTQ